MLPFENMVADYIKETNNHVAYRVIPVYASNNLLASGVHVTMVYVPLLFLKEFCDFVSI